MDCLYSADACLDYFTMRPFPPRLDALDHRFFSITNWTYSRVV